MEMNNKEHLEQIKTTKLNDQSELRQDGNLVGQRITPDVEEQKQFTTIGEHSRNAVVKRRARMQPLIAGLRKWLAAKKERVQNKIAIGDASTDTSTQCERQLRPNARDSLSRKTATELEEEELIRREKARIQKAKQRASEKEEEKLIIREKARIAKAKRRAAEKERKRSEVLSIYTPETEIETVIVKMKVHEEDEDVAAETQRETEKTRSRKLKLAREKWAHKRASETEQQRSSRLQRERKQRARRMALETDQQQFIRLELERAKKAAAKRTVAEDLRLQNMQVSADQQQQDLMNLLIEVNKDQQSDIDDSIEDDFQYFEIYECCPKELLDEKVFEATSTQISTLAVRASHIPQSDVICNVQSSIYKKRQSDQLQRPSDHPCTTTSRDYILSTIFWHKNRSHLVDDGFDETLI